MIISGGFNIFPSDLEAILLADDQIVGPQWSGCRARNGANAGGVRRTEGRAMPAVRAD